MEQRSVTGAEVFVKAEHSDSERLEWLEAHLDRLEQIRAGINAGMSVRTSIDLLIEGTNY